MSKCWAISASATKKKWWTCWTLKMFCGKQKHTFGWVVWINKPKTNNQQGKRSICQSQPRQKSTNSLLTSSFKKKYTLLSTVKFDRIIACWLKEITWLLEIEILCIDSISVQFKWSAFSHVKGLHLWIWRLHYNVDVCMNLETFV